MGIVSRGMLWCYCFTMFLKITLLSLSKWRKKRVKPGGCAHGQTKSPDHSLEEPKSFIHQIGKKKSSPAFANHWLLLVLFLYIKGSEILGSDVV